MFQNIIKTSWLKDLREIISKGARKDFDDLQNIMGHINADIDTDCKLIKNMLERSDREKYERVRAIKEIKEIKEILIKILVGRVDEDGVLVS